MAGFRKAKAEQAALKMGIYGPPGSGKTFTSLLVAEGLAKLTSRRVAFVDTERGTDFYVQAVKDRQHHPAPFDIDSLYTRSITETIAAVKSVDPKEHAVIVIDSITHLWEAAIAAYRGPKTRAGTLPMNAWGTIKRPYKELMNLLINSPLHVLILGRQGNEWAEDEATGETVQTGYKMKAEGETPYEPHILVRIAAIKPKEGRTVKKTALAVPTAFIEKDRSGILSGRLIEWPNFDSLAAPLLGLFGGTQARIESDEDAGARDAEALDREQRDRARQSFELREKYEARCKLAANLDELRAIGAEITPAVKKQFTTADHSAVREAWLNRESILKGQPAAPTPEYAGDHTLPV